MWLPQSLPNHSIVKWEVQILSFNSSLDITRSRWGFSVTLLSHQPAITKEVVQRKQVPDLLFHKDLTPTPLPKRALKLSVKSFRDIILRIIGLEITVQGQKPTEEVTREDQFTCPCFSGRTCRTETIPTSWSGFNELWYVKDLAQDLAHEKYLNVGCHYNF